MTPFDVVVDALPDFRLYGPGRGMARCPAHKDRRRSLSVREFASGACGLHCFAGCDTESVVASLGLRMEELFPARNYGPGTGHKGEARPFTAKQVLDALSHELDLVWLLLSDIAGGRSIDATTRRRAGVAGERCQALIEELRLAGRA